ncbi:hypothetical protein [Caldimonas brevitalea]|uniref:Uncharacterized protein n=1 Tax=Caldimonas brevitalea TaxID=413882 RepID=A0A0G3BP64_9BURK|nr:hypothetical protein [Caldimonas brevitalea]AKJ29161.1 hypothetical protein AAW51_2470 [Caldimonas brevitalea]
MITPVAFFAFAVLMILVIAAGLHGLLLRRLTSARRQRWVPMLELAGHGLLALTVAGLLTGYVGLQASLTPLQAQPPSAVAVREAARLKRDAATLLAYECESETAGRRALRIGFCPELAGGAERALMPTAEHSPANCPPAVDEFLQCRNYLPPHAQLCSAARRTAQAADPAAHAAALGQVLRGQTRFTLCPPSGVALGRALVSIKRLEAERRSAEWQRQQARAARDPRSMSWVLWITVVCGVLAAALKAALAFDTYYVQSAPAPAGRR